MATVAVLMANIVRLGKAVGVYAAVPAPNAQQRAALTKNVKLLNTNIGGLAKAMGAVPVPPPVVVPVDPVPVETPPNFGGSKERSITLYYDWVMAWLRRAFPDAGTFDPGAVAKVAKAAGCLAQVSATGVILGWPDGPWADLGDWSLYTGLVGTSLEAGQIEFRVYHLGKLVGSKVGGTQDGLAFAASLGFNW
jgi:hypothetical protein